MQSKYLLNEGGKEGFLKSCSLETGFDSSIANMYWGVMSNVQKIYKKSAKSSLTLFTQIHLFVVVVLLKYSSHSIQFIYLTCTIQWPLYSHRLMNSVSKSLLENFRCSFLPKPHTLWLPPPLFPVFFILFVCLFLLLILLCILSTCGFHWFFVGSL